MSPDKLPGLESETIASQQILAHDHSVFSIQWVVIPPEFDFASSSAELLDWYLAYIEKCTLKLVQVVRRSDGVEFRLRTTPLALIRFCQPQLLESADEERTVLQISGGFLVQRKQCDRGQLEIIVERAPTGSRLILKLSDYCPLLLGSDTPSLGRKWLYRFSQAYIHNIVIVRFLAKVYRQVTGRPVRKGVVKMVVRQGIAT